MKTLHIPHFRLTIIPLLACLTTSLIAQSDLPPLPPGSAYFGATLTPSGGGGGFQPDDSGPPGGFGGNGGSGGPAGCTNCFLPEFGTNLGLIITLSSNQEFVNVSLTNSISNVNYILLVTTNLATGWITNQSLLATSTVTVAAPYWTYDYPAVFFKAKEGPAPTNGTLKWSAFISSSGNDYFGNGLDSSPAVSSVTGEILITVANYLSPTNCQLFAVDPVFGEVQWVDNIFNPTLTNTVAFQTGELTGSATISPNGMIYVGGLDGNLYCLFPDGFTNWIKPAGNEDAIYSTPAIGNNGLIYVTSDEAEVAHAGSDVITGVTAFNTNGTTNWFFVPQDLFYGNYGDVDSSAVVGADGSIYFVGEGSRLYALTATGQLKWFLPLAGDGEPSSTPALAPDGTIVVGSGMIDTNSTPSPYLYDVNPDGSLNWILNVASLGGGHLIACAPTIDQNGVIYMGSGNAHDEHQAGLLFAVNPSGSVKWIFTNEANFIMSAPALAKDGTVYVGDGNEKEYAVSSNGSLAWASPFFANGPVASSTAILPDGSVVFASGDGNLYCLWGSAPLNTNAPWPMLQQSLNHDAQQTSLTVTNSTCGAPFVFNGAYSGTAFNFSMTGTPGSSNWNVYTSTNLANTNWITIASNLVMQPGTGNTNFTDTGVAGVTNKFYIVGRSNCNSQAIGFVNQIVTPGTNLVADQLYQVDENVLFQEYNSSLMQPMNTLNALFAISNAWGLAQTNTAIYKWTGTGFIGDTNNGSFIPTWVGSGDLTLLPGSSALMNNKTSHSFTNTYVGLIRNEQIFHIQPGTTYLSATVPVAGNVTNITGYPAHSGDVLKFWSTNSQSFVSHTNISGTWSNGGLTNNLRIGEGFVLVTANTYTWTNIWE